MKMMKHLETYKQYDVIIVPFTYTDNIEKSKRRPAVIISENKRFNLETGKLVCAMITTGKSLKWSYDIEINDLKTAGLKKPCVIRMKLFTIDKRIVIEKIGQIEKKDRHNLIESLKTLFMI